MDSGVFELDPQGRRCFRPNVPRFPPIEDILDVLEPATAAVREFDRALSAWERPGLVGRLFARLDAVHSSGAEGSTTTFSELMEYQSSLRSAPDVDDAAAVAACAEAIETESRGDVDPIEVTLRIHRRLFAHARDRMAGEAAGRLKARVNGTADREAPGGFFYYTQPASVAAALDDWRAFTLASDPRTPELARHILSHWMFEHIHPVTDGNGRIGRLLVPLMLRSKCATRAALCLCRRGRPRGQGPLCRSARGRPPLRRHGPVDAARAVLPRAQRHGKPRPPGAPRRGRRAVAPHRRGVSLRQHGPQARALRPDAAGLHHARRARRHRRHLREREHRGAARLVEAGVLTIANGARRDRLYRAGAVLEIFDRFRAGRRPGG